MTHLLAIAALVLAYFVGSIPTAFLMGRARGIDIRRHGSGNIGATNAFRVLGRRWGITCLLIDVLKGYLPVMVLAPELLAPPEWPRDGWMWMVGVAAILGHMYTPWLRFSGGKGVATSLGVVLAIVPVPMLVAAAVGGFLVWLTGYVSVGSLTGAALLPLLILGYEMLWRGRPAGISILVTVALAAAIFYKHRSNIARLRAGTEKHLFDKPTVDETQ